MIISTLVAALLVAPVTVLATSEPASREKDDAVQVVVAADLAGGVPLTALRLSEGAAAEWAPVEGGLPGEIAAAGLSPGAQATAALTVEGPTPFAFWGASAGAGLLSFRVNGQILAQFTSDPPRPFDLYLPEGTHVLEWVYTARETGAVGRAILEGAKGLLPPELVGFVHAFKNCGTEPLRVRLFSAVPLNATGTEARLGGITLSATTRVASVGFRVEHEIVVDLSEYAGSHGRWPLHLRVRDTLGKVWDLGERLLDLDARLLLWAEPHGWVYDLRPTIRVFTACELRGATLGLQVGGTTVAPLLGNQVASYTVERDLAFNETLPYAFEVKLPKGKTQRLTGEIREGLDVMEFNLTTGSLVVAALRHGTAVGNPRAPEELPVQVTSDARTPEITPLSIPIPKGGLRVRALYAPLALVCTEAEVLGVQACAPYGGDAPGFYQPYWLEKTSLTLRAEDGVARGSKVHGGAAGQLVAATYLTKAQGHEPPPLPELPEVRPPTIEAEAGGSVRVEAFARLRVSDVSLPLG